MGVDSWRQLRQWPKLIWRQLWMPSQWVSNEKATYGLLGLVTKSHYQVHIVDTLLALNNWNQGMGYSGLMTHLGGRSAQCQIWGQSESMTRCLWWSCGSKAIKVVVIRSRSRQTDSCQMSFQVWVDNHVWPRLDLWVMSMGHRNYVHLNCQWLGFHTSMAALMLDQCW